MGTVEAVFLRPSARTPVRSVDAANVLAGIGIEGDHAGGGKRQITILSREAWQQACRELGKELDPSIRRANVLVSGVDLAATIGSTLRIGDVVIDVNGETRPCELMDDDGRVGLCATLQPDRRGGVHGIVREGGSLRVGDPVVVEPPGA
ncbi:MAG: MOSC domain-containing protein [Planctomycetota bacterium]